MVKRRPTYWDTVFSEIVKLGEGVRRDPTKARIHGDPSFTYTEIPSVQRSGTFHGLTGGYFMRRL